MPTDRFFVACPSFFKGQNVQLESSEHHHLFHVMRATLNQEVDLINGNHQLAKARIRTLTKERATLTIETVQNREPPPFFCLAQALPRQPRLEYILEKATELGAREIWLFPAENSEKKSLSKNQEERLKHILISALKQCGRLDLPTLIEKPSLSKWPPFSHPLYFGDLHPDLPLLSQKLRCPCTFIIGPEKGFSLKEKESLKKIHAKPIRLSPHILRVDTAAIAACCTIDFNSK
jgi:16S rRNA (uracil1498-N3)-methyltransferase